MQKAVRLGLTILLTVVSQVTGLVHGAIATDAYPIGSTLVDPATVLRESGPIAPYASGGFALRTRTLAPASNAEYALSYERAR